MKRNALLLPLLLLGIVFLFPLISSANVLTTTTPAVDEVIVGATYNVSATFDTMTQDVTNVTFYYCTGACASWTSIDVDINDSENDTYFSVLWDTTAITDIDDIVVNASAVNWTNYFFANDNNTGIDIHNGVPTATWSSASAHYDYRIKQTNTLTYGLSADNTIGISSCIVSFTDRENGSVYGTSTTTSANACANTSINPNHVGLLKGHSYDVRVQATDGNGNNTNSTVRPLGILTNPASAPSGGGVTTGTAQSFVSSFGRIFTADFWKDFWDFLIFWD